MHVLTSVCIYSPTNNILDSILVSGSYDGTMKMWSVYLGTEISSEDIGYIGTMSFVSGSVYMPPEVDGEIYSVGGKDKRALALPSTPLLFYSHGDGVQILVVSTGFTTLDHELFLPPVECKG